MLKARSDYPEAGRLLELCTESCRSNVRSGNAIARQKRSNSLLARRLRLRCSMNPVPRVRLASSNAASAVSCTANRTQRRTGRLASHSSDWWRHWPPSGPRGPLHTCTGEVRFAGYSHCHRHGDRRRRELWTASTRVRRASSGRHPQLPRGAREPGFALQAVAAAPIRLG